MLIDAYLFLISLCEIIHIVLEDIILISAVISTLYSVVIKMKKSMNLKRSLQVYPTRIPAL